MARKKKELPILKNILISDLAAEGKSIAKTSLNKDDETQIVVFIPYGAPGDIADIKVDKKKQRYAEGHILEIKEPSPIRIKPKCPHFGLCGGCKWQHIPYDEQLRFKTRQVKDNLERIGKVIGPETELKEALPSANVWAYRNKMEYTFSDKKWRTWEEINSNIEFSDSPNALGFHIPGCFDKVLHIDNCFLQNDIGNRIRNFIYEYAENLSYSFYNIKSNSGFLRNLMIRISSTGQIMVCVVFGYEDNEKIKELLEAVKERFPEITSLLYIINKKLNDSISDQKVISYFGPDYIEEVMEGLKFRVNAKSFYQTNSLQAFELYKIVRKFASLVDFIDKDKKPVVYDLYTGAGTIANFIAKDAEKVVGIEYVEEAIEDAKLNSQINGIVNTAFFAGDMKDVLTEDFIRENGKPDVMIIDPPRAGMHDDVVKTILKVLPERIVYVSCNPATQARDLALLSGQYHITDIQPVDMFPHTHHIENVVRLDLKEYSHE